MHWASMLNNFVQTVTLEVEAGEKKIVSGPANLQRGPEAVGGVLTLTNQRLAFRPHRCNRETAPTDIRLQTIARVDLAWSRAFKRLPLWPNSIRVVVDGGTSFQFVVDHRADWKRKIEQQVDCR
ncbi:MAG: hypothetical protein JXR83_05230 [Deltaproteobacteria bacterium]|nr:hypothetical protein [Deltaproteobacteria bacterium]